MCVLSAVTVRDLCVGVLTSSQVGGRGQVGEVIQADDVDDGADHSRMVLHGREEKDRIVNVKQSHSSSCNYLYVKQIVG